MILPSGFRLDVATITTPFNHKWEKRRLRIMASAMSVTLQIQIGIVIYVRGKPLIIVGGVGQIF